MSKVLYSVPNKGIVSWMAVHLPGVVTEADPSIDIIITDGNIETNLAELAKPENEDLIHFCSGGFGDSCCKHAGMHGGYIVKSFIEMPYACPPDYFDREKICTESINLDKFVGKTLHLLGSQTGRTLGKELVDNHGLLAFIGFDEATPFGVGVGYTPPGGVYPDYPPDPYYDFFSFNDAVFEAERAILQGKTIGEAVQAMKDKYQFYIEKYTTGEWKDRPVAPLAIEWMNSNMSHIIAHGDMSVRPVTGITPPPSENSYTLLIVVVVIALLWGILKK